MIDIYIADSTALVREGLKAIISPMKNVRIVGEAESLQDLSREGLRLQPDILVLNYASKYFSIDKIGCWKNFMPNTKILAITPEQSNETIIRAMEAGVTSHVMIHCSKEEISDAISETVKGHKFFCSTIVANLMQNDVERKERRPINSTCDPIKISNRELEIIDLIAQGLTTKEIASKLFLSAHTVMTHRKNIMSKLGVKNTAGIVIYAVKENLISPNKYMFDSAIN